MFSHPMSLLGIFISGAGWLFLTTRVGVSSALLPREIVNIHSMTIAENVIYLGYVMIIVGVISDGLKALTLGRDLRPTQVDGDAKQQPQAVDAGAPTS